MELHWSRQIENLAAEYHRDVGYHLDVLWLIYS